MQTKLATRQLMTAIGAILQSGRGRAWIPDPILRRVSENMGDTSRCGTRVWDSTARVVKDKMSQQSQIHQIRLSSGHNEEGRDESKAPAIAGL